METISLSVLGSLVIVHLDGPDDAEVKRRLGVLLMGKLPKKGLIEVWPGDTPDELWWRKLAC